ncbi:MAG: hypothetical protein WC730_00690 [Patescibacteria group bacterium]|jgi:hypothetical protein
MDKLQELEKRISKIESRNKRVELDKRWEGSFTRKILLMIFTFIAIFVYFIAIGIDRAFINAVVPTVGFLLSTLTLPIFKRFWVSKNKKIQDL